jgi:hypothetical protein
MSAPPWALRLARAENGHGDRPEEWFANECSPAEPCVLCVSLAELFVEVRRASDEELERLSEVRPPG